MLIELFQKGDYLGVLEAAQQNDLNPHKDPIQSMLVAASHLELGNPDQTLKLCHELKASLGSRIDFRKLMASALRRSGRLKEAELFYRDTLQRFPKDLELKSNFANLLVDINKQNEAKILLEQISQEKPDDTKAKESLLQLSSLEAAPTQTSKALLTKARKSRKRPADNDETSAVHSFDLDPLAMAFSEDEVKEDQRLRREKKKHKPPVPMPKLPALEQQELTEELLAAARQAINDQAASVAIEFAKDLLATDKFDKYDEVYGLLGDAYMQIHKYDAAESCFLTGLELGGKMMHAHVNLVSLACMRRDKYLARRRLVTAIESGITPELQEKLLEQVKRIELDPTQPSLSEVSLYPVSKTTHQQKTP